MDFVGFTLSILQTLAKFAGNWGLAIILLTIIVRACMWPSSISQQRSMRNMQLLQPKMKAIQERYKSNPQMMQQKMMEFYKENKFNPMAGCLPLLLQLPVFILLYTALMSPQFIQQAGNAKFLFINRLDATIKSTAGQSFDGKFVVGPYDTFTAGKTATVYIGERVLENVKVDRPTKAITVQGEIKPKQNFDLKMYPDSLKLSFAELKEITKVEVNVIDNQTKETEKVTFLPVDNVLAANVPVADVQSEVHYDVIFLVLLFALTMWVSQKVMMSTQKGVQQDPTQQAIQKSMGTVMPLMIGLTFIFIPIPAGVLLYLVTSNVFQIVQTVIINKQLDKEDEVKKTSSNADIENAKKIEPKEVK